MAHSGQMNRQVSLALRAPFHLACTDGPDRGMIVTPHQPLLLGRNGSFTLTDPAASRRHCYLRPARARDSAAGYLEDLKPTNPTQVGRRVAETAVALRRGERVRIGKSIWRVRPRPTDLTWPEPPESSNPRRWIKIMRFLPILILFPMLVRFTALPLTAWLIILGIILLLAGANYFSKRRRRKRHYDPAFLALALESRRAGTSGTPNDEPPTSTWVWLSHVGGRRAQVGPQHHLGFVGPGARSQARWVAAQVALAHPQLNWAEAAVDTATAPDIWVKGPDDTATPPARTIVVAWGPRLETIPPEVMQIFPAVSLASPLWLLPPPCTGHATLPTQIDLAALGTPLTEAAITKRWKDFDAATTTWSVPVGLGRSSPDAEPDLIALGLEEHGAHTLFAGGTGAGKSVALRTWIISLCAHFPPRALRVVLVDYKGGAGLGPLASLPHVERFHTDLDASQTAWMLQRLRFVLQERKELLHRGAHADIRDWESSGSAPPRLLLVIDEFQALAEEHPQFLSALGKLAAQGRSLGIHLVLSTQHPGPAINAALRATLDQRVALRCNEIADSLAVVGTPAATELPRQPGRALFNGTVFQFAQANLDGFPSPADQSRPRDSLWPAPLPTYGPPPAPQLLGVIEDESRHPRLCSWRGETLAIAGSASTREELGTFAAAVARNAQSDTTLALGTTAAGFTHSHPLSALGDIALALRQLPHCSSTTLWVNEIGAILREFEAIGLGAEAQRIWMKTIRASPGSRWQMLVTDTEGHASISRIASRLLRLPTPAAWSDPSLLRLLPPLTTAFSGTGDSRRLSQEEATSGTPLRFVAEGLSDVKGPVALQGINPAQTEITAIREDTQGLFVPLSGRPPLTSLAGGTLVGGSESLSRHLGADHLPRTSWTTALQNLTTPVALFEPGVDSLRHLGHLYPDDSLWLRAYHPFDQNCGVLAARSEIIPCRFPNL